jgi:hypothetical protein
VLLVVTLAIVMASAASNGVTIRLVSVPRFSTTGTAVLLNMATLECQPLHFSLPRD